ncbi:glycerol-3-phosphate 1-O-acyltransferase PlsY [Anaplasma capra]|uniref:glycerol-3-phosphate 1-O-acyltransferase PlsY n=1 Tax=Anaplasma capra TaxID=1562740 RepID=UPI0021D60E57|nr:glycerol-3-phosphate 1-O-acyltransferase PlsY [Anaplasma capra]MCU7611188.1 glycerol-3-phosphate 1-O-acyltransferase PlsY [Anaplasma capra]
MGDISIVLIILTSYFIGSVPFSWILGKFFLKVDIKKVGSGNSGSTNVFRINKKISILALLLDIAKSALVTLFLKVNGFTKEITYLIGFISVFGHIFPVWFRFKGGKGIASTIGVIMVLNTEMFYLFIATWVVFFVIYRYSSLSSILAILISCSHCLIIEDIIPSIVYLITSIVIIWKHKENIIRIKNGVESKLF